MNTKTHFLQYFIFSALLFALLTTSCVTNRKYQYLQKDDVNATADEILKDTVLRNYDIVNFEYRIQSEDILSIRFKSLTNEEFDFFSQTGGSNTGGGSQGAGLLLSGYLVDENGEIEFPVVGNVKVAGLSVYEAQNAIQEIAERYLDDPVVDVRLLNFRFTVLGQVNGEGTITSFNNRTSILEAIGLAGGLGELADRHNIKIIRQEGRQARVYYIDLLEENFVNSKFYYINQNDVIIVPPLKQRPYRTYFGENLGLFVSSLSFLLLVYGLLYR